MHNPFNILHHYDGIVHEETDGQHHGEHGKCVDGHAEQEEHGERAEQDNWNRNDRDQRRTEALQEDQDNDKYEDNRFIQRFLNFMDRGFDEGCRVNGELVLQIGWKGWRHVPDGFLDSLGCFERVCARRQRDRHTRCRLAIEASDG